MNAWWQGTVLDDEASHQTPETRLRARFTGPELVRLAARALGIYDGHRFMSDRRIAIVVGAVKQLPDADLLAGLQAMRGDQVALAGASTLFHLGVGEHLKPELRAQWLPTLVEAALIQEGNVPRCALLLSLGGSGAKAVPLLLKIRRGRSSSPEPRSPSRRA